MEHGKNESFVSVSLHLYWKVSGKESCCVQGNPCCHIILSAVSLTACLTYIVLALVTEQLHRCDYPVFVPISGKVLVSSVPNKNCEWCGFWRVFDVQVCEWECRVLQEVQLLQSMWWNCYLNTFTFADTFLYTIYRNWRGFSEEGRHHLQHLKQWELSLFC